MDRIISLIVFDRGCGGILFQAKWHLGYIKGFELQLAPVLIWCKVWLRFPARLSETVGLALVVSVALVQSLGASVFVSHLLVLLLPVSLFPCVTFVKHLLHCCKHASRGRAFRLPTVFVCVCLLVRLSVFAECKWDMEVNHSIFLNDKSINMLHS